MDFATILKNNAKKEPECVDIRHAVLTKYPDVYHGDKWAKIYDDADNIRNNIKAELELLNFKSDVDVYATIVKMDDHCIVYM